MSMLTDSHQEQTRPGQVKPCCPSMKNALRLGYILKGYFMTRAKLKAWVPWRFNLAGEGWVETSTIRGCPFCLTDLDRPEG